MCNTCLDDPIISQRIDHVDNFFAICLSRFDLIGMTKSFVSYWDLCHFGKRKHLHLVRLFDVNTVWRKYKLLSTLFTIIHLSVQWKKKYCEMLMLVAVLSTSEHCPVLAL